MPNIFSLIPQNLSEELKEEIVTGDSLRVERIVSKGQSTPEGEWYDQDQDEWVILLKGNAKLTIEGKKITTHLRPGDYVHLPAHQKHRVEWTDPQTETVWLALHYDSTRKDD